MGTNLLLSRVANACFWMSRYRERAEFTARIVEVNLVTLLDASKIYTAPGDSWEAILRINDCYDRYSENEWPFDLSSVLRCLYLDAANPNSILSCIRTARENARQAREQISSEMWEQINHMFHDINHLSLDDLLADPHEHLQAIKSGALLIQGLADQTMLHGEAWHFVQIGRYLERANTTCRLLAQRSDPEWRGGQGYQEAVHWIAVLKSVSSLEAFHKTYASPVSVPLALEFLLLSEELPRSILYCVETIQRSLIFISGSTGRRFENSAERLAGQVASRLKYLRLEDIDLLPFLMEMQTNLANLSDSIAHTYITYEVA